MNKKYYLKDKKVNVYQQKDVSEPGGFPKTANVCVLTNGWAYVRQLSQKELNAAKAVSSDEEMLFVINYLTGIEVPGCYVVYKDKKYQVTRIDTFDGYKSDLTLYTEGGTKNDNT